MLYNNIMTCKVCSNSQLNEIFNIELFKYFNMGNLSSINIVSCQKCGFCFNDKITQEDCNNYYENSQNYTHNLYKSLELNHEKYGHLPEILNNLNIQKTDAIIDLTSSDGSLLYYLKNIGYTNLTFCDISIVNLNATEYANKYKLNITDKSDYININKKFKVIFFNHTLEHLADINTIFDNIKLLMDNDSFLYIEVPDIDRIKTNNNPFLELTYEHINFFNAKILNNLCNNHKLTNILNGTLDFKYRLKITINALYGIYKLNDKQPNDILINHDLTTNLMTYINQSKYEMELIYKQIDVSKTYSIVGFGLYALYFLSIYKNLIITNIYDETKVGIINNINIENFNSIKCNDGILILSPSYYDMIYLKLINNNIDKRNIVSLNYSITQ